MSDWGKFSVYFDFCGYDTDFLKTNKASLWDVNLTPDEVQFTPGEVLHMYQNPYVKLDLTEDVDAFNDTTRTLVRQFSTIAYESGIAGSSATWTENSVKLYRRIVDHADEDYPAFWNEAVIKHKLQPTSLRNCTFVQN